MGKPASSSISKAKRSKRSSQGRIKKRSKTKRSKSKKLRRRDDSDSYSEGSRNSGSVSSSRSDDSHRGRRSRSRGRKDAKGSKKRSRARSSSSEDSRRGRKERRSKRKDGSQERKRTRRIKMKRKKKIKRDASINSRSSGCSTCESPSNISGESKYERRRGRSKKRENGKRIKHIEIERERIENRVMRRRNGSSDSFNEDKVSHKNAPIRLKSVITSAAEDKEVRELVKDKEEMIYDHDEDELKEEMIFDHDDYPSSRSNDSNDEGDKRDSAHQLHAASEKRGPMQDEKRGNALIPNSRTTKLTETNNEKEGQSVRDKKDNHWNGINDAILDKKNEVFEAVGGLNSDDLESILRKKALENLKRFRGGPLRSQTSAKSSINDKDTSDRTIKQPPTEMSELSQIRSPSCDPVPKIPPQYDDSGVVAGDSTQSSHIGEKIPYRKNGESESEAAKNINCPLDLVVDSRKNINVTVGSGNKRPRLVASALRQALSNTSTSSEIVPTSPGSDKARPLTGTRVGGSSVQSTHVVTHLAPTGNVGDSSVQSPHVVTPQAPTSNVGDSSVQSPHAVTPQAPTSNVGESSVQSSHAVTPLAPTGNVDKVKNDMDPPSDGPYSSLASAGGDVILQDEVKDGSQLEQKTMSVMRGGELVQVSYKVYIPKKVPALARRQLKR